MAVYSETIEIKDNASKPLGDAQQSASGLASQMGGLQAELAAATGGLSLVVEAAAALAVGFAALVVAGGAFAIKASEAKNASLSLWSALGQGKITGDEVDDMLDDMRSKTGLTKDSLGKFAESFLRMGITGKDALEGLTIAAASAEAVIKGGADAFAALYSKVNLAAEAGQKLTIPFKKIQTQLIKTGLNVGDLAKEMGLTEKALTDGLNKGTIDAKKFGDAMQNAITKKGAGPMATLANSAKNLGELLNEYLGDLFEDLGSDIAPFMSAVKDLFGILDSKGTSSGKALKEGIQAFFKNVFALAAKVIPMIKHFLLDIIIYALKAYIFLKPIGKAIQEIWENNDGMGKLLQVWEMIKPALIFVALAVGLVVVAFVALWAAGMAIVIVVETIALAIGSFVADTAATLVGWALSAAEAAYNFVAGLVGGITSGAGMVIDAVKGLAKGALGAFTGFFQMGSPSKLMMKQGDHVGTGFAMGIEDTAPDVHGASTSLSGAALAGASSAPQAAAAGGKGGGISVIVEAGAIIIEGAGKAAEDITEEMIALIFERIALGAGL